MRAGALLRGFEPLLLRALMRAERRTLTSSAVLKYPLVFVIGPPRSGTTLLYQVLTDCLEVAYITNLAARFSSTPVTATRLGMRLIARRTTDYESRHGVAPGWAAAHEGGPIWNRWFPMQVSYADASTLDSAARRECYRTVAGLERAFGAPFFNKNVMHSERMRALDDLFPGCLFLRVRRDPVDVVASVLRARAAVGVSADHWWSVRPRDVAEIPPEDETVAVCHQVHGVERDIDDAARELGAARILDVDYTEGLCADPRGTLAAIREFLAPFGVQASVRAEPPLRFEIRRASLEREKRCAIEEALAELTRRGANGVGVESG